MTYVSYDYFKNYYSLVSVDLSRQIELDADPKAIQQIEYLGQLKIQTVQLLIVK